MLVRLLLPLTCACLLTAGCGERAAATTVAATGAAPPVAESVASAAPTVALPRVPDAGRGREPERAFTVTATATTMRFDNAAAVDALLAAPDDAARTLVREAAGAHGGDARAGLLIDGAIDVGETRNHMIAPLYELIADAVQRAREQATRREQRPQTTLALAIDPVLKIAAVLDVLVTAGRGEVRSYVALVEGPSGPRGVAFSPPRACSRAEKMATCWSPAVVVGGDGVFVGLAPGGGAGGCLDDGRDHVVPLPHRRGGLLLAARAGGCPTVPRSVGAALPDEVDALLDGLAPKVPRCPAIQIAAEPGVPWGDVAPLMSRLARRGELVFSDTPAVPTGCDAALTGEQLAAAVTERLAEPEGADDESVWGGLAPVHHGGH